MRREIVEALLSRPDRTLALLGELEGGRIKAEELDPLRRIQLLNHRRSDVRDRAKKLLAGQARRNEKKSSTCFGPRSSWPASRAAAGKSFKRQPA